MKTKKRNTTPVRSGRRTTKGTGQGWGMSVTSKQLRAYRKAAKKSK